mgnify:CR=1 FL=1
MVYPVAPRGVHFLADEESVSVPELTRAIAVECAPQGIRANAICPAAMPYTGFMAAGGMNFPPEALDKVVGRYDFGPGFTVAITREGGTVHALREGILGAAQLPIFPEAPVTSKASLVLSSPWPSRRTPSFGRRMRPAA